MKLKIEFKFIKFSYKAVLQVKSFPLAKDFYEIF